MTRVIFMDNTMKYIGFLIFALFSHASEACLCFTTSGVNVRSTPCGTVIGSASSPQCFSSNSRSTQCSLGGITYNFQSFDFNGREGWSASNFLRPGSASDCAGGGNCANVQIVSRSAWGARPPRSSTTMATPVAMAFVHHTAGRSCSTQSACITQVRNIQNYHMDTTGWSDIGYSFLIGEDGRVYEGRGWRRVGAHTQGYNSRAIAASVMGDFTSRNPNSAAQNAVRNLLDCGVQQGYLTSGYEMFGHRDGGCTTCPGNTFYSAIQSWPRYSRRDIPRYC